MVAASSSLIVDVRLGETLLVSSGCDIAIELVKKSGQLARLRLTAPRDVKIERRDKAFDSHVASMAE